MREILFYRINRSKKVFSFNVQKPENILNNSKIKCNNYNNRNKYTNSSLWSWKTKLKD